MVKQKDGGSIFFKCATGQAGSSPCKGGHWTRDGWFVLVLSEFARLEAPAVSWRYMKLWVA